MNRVLVLGPPGSGKSTLARRLGARHELPVFHLDQAYWRPGLVETDSAAFRAEVDRIAALPSWVIDGNHTHTLAPRLARADTVFYIDAPSWLCMARVLNRAVLNYGQVGADAASGCPERFDPAFFRFVWAWSRKRREGSLATVRAFPGRTIVLSPDQAAAA